MSASFQPPMTPEAADAIATAAAATTTAAPAPQPRKRSAKQQKPAEDKGKGKATATQSSEDNVAANTIMLLERRLAGIEEALAAAAGPSHYLREPAMFGTDAVRIANLEGELAQHRERLYDLENHVIWLENHITQSEEQLNNNQAYPQYEYPPPPQ